MDPAASDTPPSRAESHTGFILQAVERTTPEGAAVHLYGRLSDGRTFLVREGRLRPHFWIREADVERARTLGLRPSNLRAHDLSGARLCALWAKDSRALEADAARLEASSVDTFEADVRLPQRLLMARGLRGAVTLTGPCHSGRDAQHAPEARHVDCVFDDPTLTPARFTPRLRVLSFDIETNPNAQRLLSVALFGLGAAEVMVVPPPGQPAPASATAFPHERALLAAFARRVIELDPDVLTGWNVVDFDLRFLEGVGKRLGTSVELGRGAGGLRVDAARFRYAAVRAHIPGRVVLDGLELVRGAFMPFEEHNLDFVARAVLGEGKLAFEEAAPKGSGAARIAALMNLYERDLPTFCRYNLRDAELALGIVEKLRLVELAVERSRLSGMQPDRVNASVASFELLYGAALHARGIATPNRPPQDAPFEPTTGGHVLEPVAGLHAYVASLDFKSLYPSLIRTFEIDPLGHARAGEDAIVAPNGARFSRERGVLPALLDELVAAREAHKREGDETGSHAIKILMNSFYGVLGTPACRYHDPDLANAITTFGRDVLLWTRDFLEAAGHRVLYGDTDSLFVETHAHSGDGAREVAAALAQRVNEGLRAFLLSRHRVVSRLELEVDTVYIRLFFPPMRHRGAANAQAEPLLPGGSARSPSAAGTTGPGEAAEPRNGGGARKRYVGLAYERGATRVVFTGMEVVRSDWTALAKNVQRGLYERLFSAATSSAGATADTAAWTGEREAAARASIASYLQEVTRALQAGALDGELVYKKALRKPLDAYTASAPPHVVAARKLEGGPGRNVRYVITVAGPEPADERRHALDREHYLEKQVRPVAEPVLELCGLAFDDVVGRARQLSLL